MKVRIFKKDESILKLSTLIGSWMTECKMKEFGVHLNLVEFFEDFKSLIALDNKDLMVLEVDNKIVGLMGLIFFKSPTGLQYFTQDRHWYIMPEYRGNGLKMIAMAEEWAKDKKCSHLLLSVNMMASNMHDRTCKVYEKKGMQKFEITYIKKVGD